MLCLQTLDEEEFYSDEEFERFEKEYEEKRRRFYEESDAQPGEVHVSFCALCASVGHW